MIGRNPVAGRDIGFGWSLDSGKQEALLTKERKRSSRYEITITHYKL